MVLPLFVPDKISGKNGRLKLPNNFIYVRWTARKCTKFKNFKFKKIAIYLLFCVCRSDSASPTLGTCGSGRIFADLVEQLSPNDMFCCWAFLPFQRCSLYAWNERLVWQTRTLFIQIKMVAISSCFSPLIPKINVSSNVLLHNN